MKESITLADRALPVTVCPFVRSCLDCAYKGRYDFLDGMVGVHSCDAQEKTMHVWKSREGYPFFPFLDMPATIHPWALEAFKSLLQDFVKLTERFAGKELTTLKLEEAIRTYNRQRALVRELYDLRKPDPPLISGTEILQVMIALASITVEEGNELLEQLISEVKEREQGPERKGGRVLVWGGSLDHVSLTELIEGLDANLVMDDNCVGSRNYFPDVELTENPLDGLAYRYLVKLVPPRTFREAVVGESGMDYAADLESRFGYLRDYIERWGVNGVILLLVRYCDPHAYELVNVRDYLDILGVPNIYVEHDYTEGALAPLKTRMQAFIEMIG
jgi:benzoyl-CoA reductase/2-hydroxyglutaryl-CoA dehydratase subunit BcrC/BadD/HgdB